MTTLTTKNKTVNIDEVRKYANLRYSGWLDYSEFHCSEAGIPDEAFDILNEVLLSIFSKDPAFILSLFSRPGKTRKNEVFTELDFYILRMIRLNITSPTSPYQSRYISKNKYLDREVDFTRLKIIDEEDDSVDMAKIILTQYRLVIYFFNALDLTEFEREVFNHRFIDNMPVSEWPDPKNIMHLNSAFNCVKTAIHILLFEQGLTSKKPQMIKYCHNRIQELIQRFYQTHVVTIGKKSINQARA